ncbi:MAG: hypothetical protein JXR60_04215 [Bacteroidales bacterium]|nr:hypothetical protein [Bacteroidales bacterium]
MKNLWILGLIAIFYSTSAEAQRCDKYNRYCDAELLDYDYSSQSAFAFMYPGDTIPVKTVLYGNKEYHITVCSEHEGVSWKIVEPYRKTEKSIAEIRRDTSKTYKVDEYGDFIVDNETGDYIVESVSFTVDTIWNSERVAAERLIFDNKKANEWKERVSKTQRAFVYVIMPMDSNPEGSCVAVFIGKNEFQKSSFKTKKPSGDYY